MAGANFTIVTFSDSNRDFIHKKITSLRLDQDGAIVKFDVSNLSIFKFRN